MPIEGPVSPRGHVKAGSVDYSMSRYIWGAKTVDGGKMPSLNPGSGSKPNVHHPWNKRGKRTLARRKRKAKVDLDLDELLDEMTREELEVPAYDDPSGDLLTDLSGFSREE